MDKVSKSWSEFFKGIQNEEFCEKLNKFLNREYQDYTCYPPRELLFNAFKLTPLDKVKVVIVGQDPYHEPGQAMGLSFSVPKELRFLHHWLTSIKRSLKSLIVRWISLLVT